MPNGAYAIKRESACKTVSSITTTLIFKPKMLRGFKESKLVLNCYHLVRLPVRRNSVLTNKNSPLFGKPPRSALAATATTTSLNFFAADVRHFPSSKLQCYEIVQRSYFSTNVQVNRWIEWLFVECTIIYLSQLNVEDQRKVSPLKNRLFWIYQSCSSMFFYVLSRASSGTNKSKTSDS